MHVCRIGIATGFHLVSILYFSLLPKFPCCSMLYTAMPVKIYLLTFLKAFAKLAQCTVHTQINQKGGLNVRHKQSGIKDKERNKEAWIIFFIIFATANGSQFFFEETRAKIGDTPNPEIASNRLGGTPHD